MVEGFKKWILVNLLHHGSVSIAILTPDDAINLELEMVIFHLSLGEMYCPDAVLG